MSRIDGARTDGFRRARLPRLALFLGLASMGFLLVSAVPNAAAAQDLQTLLDRIERLERDLRTLNIQLARGGSVPDATASGESAGDTVSPSVNPAGVAHLDARITTIEEDLRTVTGSVEELGFQIDQLTSRIDKLVVDVDFRLSELERGGGAATPAVQGSMQGNGLLQQDESANPSPVTAETDPGTGVLGTITAEQLQNADVATPNTTDTRSAGAGDGAANQPEGMSTQELAAPDPSSDSTGGVQGSVAGAEQVAALSPQDQYAQAFALLRQAKYDEAATALQAFVDTHGDHDLASNARYWLGETYYVRSEFVRAAEVFFEAYRLAPKGPKAPDTLLKLGMALGNLGKKPEACAAFAKLSQEFPSPSPAIVSKLDRERIRNGCDDG